MKKAIKVLWSVIFIPVGAVVAIVWFGYAVAEEIFESLFEKEKEK